MKKLIIVLLASGITLATDAQTVQSRTTIATKQNPDGTTHTKINRKKHVTVRKRAAVKRPVTVHKTTTTSTSVK